MTARGRGRRAPVAAKKAAKKAAPMVDPKHAKALELYEKAVKALGRKDFARAMELLDSLIETHSGETDLVERARAFRVIAERGKARSFRPKSFEDLLNYGVFLHNRGEHAEALKALQQAAAIHPRNEHVLYCLAAAAAQAGEPAVAFKALKTAIAVSPANRSQARSDPDFDGLRDQAEFAALLHS
jgi:tetratricopeptide (TPR) repeat protein